MGRAGSTDGRPLSAVADEELAGRFREHDCRAARDELLGRHDDWLRKVVGRLAGRFRLSPADREDAQQQAFLHFLEAARTYRASAGNGRRWSFRNHAWWVVRHRFWNGLRGQRRFKGRHDWQVRSEEWLAGAGLPVGADGRGRLPPLDEASDPARAAEGVETVAAVRRVLDECDSVLRSVAERLMAGASLRAIEAELGWPYGVVRRLRDRLAAKLRPCLCLDGG